MGAKKKAPKTKAVAGAALNYEPAHHERKYYRSTKTGDRGWFVRKNGRDLIHYDRPMEVIEVPLNINEWVPDLDERPMTMMQITVVAFQADNALCTLLGMHEQSRRSWLDCSEEQKIEWMETGPSNHPVRTKLYQSLMKVLRPLAE